MMGGLVPLIVFSFSMAFTPGPNNIMVTASGVNFGFRRSLPHMIGIAVGVFIMVMIVGLGLAQIFIYEPRLQTALKYIGACYLIFLAWRISQTPFGQKETIIGSPVKFWQAVLFQWVNPKGWVFALGTLTTYTTASGNMITETFGIALINTLTSFLSVVIWGSFGSAMSPYLSNERSRKLFNHLMAGLLVLSLIPVFWRVGI